MSESNKSNPFVKADFEESQERKKERFSELSDKNKAISNQLYQESREAVKHIPFGQPILVGHHSEARHRRDVKRSWDKMDKSIDADNKAEYYNKRAKSVGTGGIASDDPQALDKLKAKLKTLVDNQEFMKRVNKEYKKGGWDAVTGLSESLRDELKNNHARFAFQEKPYPSYALSNNSANIRNTKKRIEAIEALQNSKPLHFENDEFELGVSDGRIYIEFYDGKPSDQCRDLVKQYSFRWSRYNGHWQRKATVNAMRSAEQLLEQLKTLDSCY